MSFQMLGPPEALTAMVADMGFCPNARPTMGRLWQHWSHLGGSGEGSVGELFIGVEESEEAGVMLSAS